MVKSELEMCMMNIVRSCEFTDEFPFFETKLSAFKEEQKLIEKQFDLLGQKTAYHKLDSNLTFLARLEDFCTLVKPDSLFKIPNNADLE